MTLDELINAFGLFGVPKGELLSLGEELDTRSLSSVQEAEKRLKLIKDKARKGFRKRALHLHPDRNPDPEANARFNRFNEAMEGIEALTVLSLERVLGEQAQKARAGIYDENYEQAQYNSFMAMAQHYKGPFIPLGWRENMGRSSSPPPRPQSTPPHRLDIFEEEERLPPKK